MEYGILERDGTSLSFLGKTKRQLKTCLDEINNNSIEEFSVEGDFFTDRYLDLLLARQMPRGLILEMTQVTKVGVGKIVEKCRSVLQKLSLFAACNIHPDGIKRLSECGKLISLDVAYTYLEGYDLKFLTKKLRELNISGLNLIYDDLEIVCDNPSLHYLRADHLESCSEALFVSLSTIPELRYLYLESCEIEDIDLILPKKYHCLRTLSLGNNELTSRGASKISDIQSLLSLRLTGNFRIGCDDRYLRFPKDLVRLELGACNLSNRVFYNILRCPNLKCLDISNNFDISAKGISKLVRLKNLTSLALSGVNLGPEELAAIRKLKGLEVLDLEYTNLTGKDLYHLAKLAKLNTVLIRGTPAAFDKTAQNDLKKKFNFPGIV